MQYSVKNKETAKGFYRILSLMLVALVFLNSISGYQVFALNSKGGKSFNFLGYKYLDDHSLQIWFDKNLPLTNAHKEQFKLFEGEEAGGKELQIDALELSSGQNHSISGMAPGSTYIVKTGSNSPLELGKTYTLVMSDTLTANNQVSLGAFNSNKPLSFSFSVPQLGTSYGTIEPKLSFWIPKGQTNLPVEGSIWFTVNMPIANFDDVKNNIVLKKNGQPVTFDTTIDGTRAEGAQCYAPQMTDQRNFVFLPMTGNGTTTGYDFDFGANYTLEIPKIITVNGKTIEPVSFPFSTTSVDVPPPPMSPTALKAPVQEGEGLRLQWGAISNAEGYNVYASEDPYWDYKKANSEPVVDTNHLVTGLKPGKKYYFYIAGVNGGGIGGSSNIVQGTMPGTAQPEDTQAPTWNNGSLQYGDLTQTSLTLSWSGAEDNSVGASVYQVVYQVYQDNQVLNTTPITESSYNVTGLTPGTTYSFKVQAQDGAGNESTDGPSIAVTTLPDSQAPTWNSGSLQTSNLGDSSLTLNWSGAQDDVEIAGYRIYKGGQAVNTTLITGTSYDVTGLMPNSPYSFTVKAVDKAGNESAEGPAVEVTTSADSQPPTWSNGSLQQEALSQTGLKLIWSGAVDNVAVAGYRIYQGEQLLNTTPATTTSYNVTGLAPNTAYSFTVKAVDGAGNESTTGLILQVTTLEEDKQPPTWKNGSLNAEDIQPTSMKLNWSGAEDNLGIAGYQLSVYQEGIAQPVQQLQVEGNAYELSGLLSGTSYTLVLKAKDRAGNWSKNGISLTETTGEFPMDIPVTVVTGKPMTFKGGVKLDLGNEVFIEGLVRVKVSELTEASPEVEDVAEGDMVPGGKMVKIQFYNFTPSAEKPLRLTLPVNAGVNPEKAWIYYYQSTGSYPGYRWQYQTFSDVSMEPTNLPNEGLQIVEGGTALQANVSNFDSSTGIGLFGVWTDSVGPALNSMGLGYTWEASASPWVQLVFAPQDTSGLQKYAIYRNEEKLYEKTYDSNEFYNFSSNIYRDETVEVGQTYRYRIEMTDNMGNVSSVEKTMTVLNDKDRVQAAYDNVKLYELMEGDTEDSVSGFFKSIAYSTGNEYRVRINWRTDQPELCYIDSNRPVSFIKPAEGDSAKLTLYVDFTYGQEKLTKQLDFTLRWKEKSHVGNYQEFVNAFNHDNVTTMEIFNTILVTSNDSERVLDGKGRRINLISYGSPISKSMRNALVIKPTNSNFTLKNATINIMDEEIGSSRVMDLRYNVTVDNVIFQGTENAENILYIYDNTQNYPYTVTVRNSSFGKAKGNVIYTHSSSSGRGSNVILENNTFNDPDSLILLEQYNKVQMTGNKIRSKVEAIQGVTLNGVLIEDAESAKAAAEAVLAANDFSQVPQGVYPVQIFNSDKSVRLYPVIAPVKLISGATNPEGTKVTLSFDKAMKDVQDFKEQFIVKAGGEVVSVRAAALNSQDPTKLELILAEPVTKEDEIAISYTPGSIIATDEGLLEAFADQAVTNNGPTKITENIVVEDGKQHLALPKDVDKPVTISIPAAVTGASISMAAFLQEPGETTVSTAELPSSIRIQSEVSTGENSSMQVVAEIPEGTTMTAQNSAWTGILRTPTVKPKEDVVITPDSGKTAAVDTVIEIGYDEVPLTFNRAVRLFFPGMAGKDIGYYQNGSFHKIDSVLSGDTQVVGDALPQGGDGKITVGSDLVVWTKHFTKYVLYTQSDTTTPGGNDTTPGGNDTTPGGNDTTPGGNDTTPGGDNTTPGGDNTTTPGGNSGSGGSGDTQKPTWPSGSSLTCTKTGQNEADIQWTPAADNVGIDKYKLFIDDSSTASFTVNGTQTSLHATGLPIGPHTLRIEALDAAGNMSTGGPTTPLGGEGAVSGFSVSMKVQKSELGNTVLQLDFTNGIDATLEDALKKIQLYEKDSNQAITYDSKEYIKQGTKFDTSVEMLRRLNLTYKNLKIGTKYVLKVGAEVAANNGNTLEREYGWEFTAGSTAATAITASTENNTSNTTGNTTSTGGSTTSTTEQPPVVNGSFAEGAEKVTAVEKNGVFTVDLQAAEKILNNSAQKVLVVDLTAVPATKGAKSIQLPMEVVNLAAAAKKAIVLNNGEMSIHVPTEALVQGKTMSFSLGETSQETLPAAPQDTVKKTAYQFEALSGDTPIKEFKKQLSILLPVPRQAGEKEKLGIYFLNKDTNRWEYVGGRLSGGKVFFQTNHFSTYLVAESNKTFKDIQGHWAQKDIEILSARHVVKGAEGDAFKPGNSITRAEFAALLVRMLKLEGSGASGFGDVQPRSWYANDVYLAAKAGIIRGEGKSFRPEEKITRQEMAVMIMRAYKHAGGKAEVLGQLPFADINSISSWATEDVRNVYTLKIIKGRPDGTFGGGQDANRAEGVTMLKNLMDKIGA